MAEPSAKEIWPIDGAVACINYLGLKGHAMSGDIMMAVGFLISGTKGDSRGRPMMASSGHTPNGQTDTCSGAHNFNIK